MTKTIRIAALAALTLMGVVQANAGVTNLGECYDRVISACNQGNHAESCANHGMNECDKVFPQPMTRQPSLQLENAPTTSTRLQLGGNNLKQIGMA